MKKIFLTITLCFGLCLGANAWNKNADEGIMILASKHLSAEAKALVDKHFGDSYADDVRYLYTLEQKKQATHSKDIHFLHLDRKLKPVAVEGDDALKGLEAAIAVVRNRANHPKSEVTKALRIIVNLMCDIHNISQVRIEGVPQSVENFRLKYYSGDTGKRKKLASVNWRTYWSIYTGWHAGFSGALWAEDLEIYIGHRRAELSKGSLQDWVAQIGKQTAEIYSFVNPEYEMPRRQRNELEELNLEMMARASFRLAALINDIVK